MKRVFVWIFTGVVILFALIGLLFASVFVAMQFGLLNVRGSIDERNRFFLGADGNPQPALQRCRDNSATCPLRATPQWEVVVGGLEKDKEVIQRVAKETGVSPRLLASVVVPEQIRFFTAEREVYKRYFEPLKILASLSQFSLGVSGIKEETAKQIERNAENSSSPFYTGVEDQALLAYKAGEEDRDRALYDRLTDAHDHYYSYLYTALYIKQIQKQWSDAGFSIASNPDITATLFNLGFGASKPNAFPLAGGASVSAGGTVYSYGTLAGEAYRSEELTELFPN